MDKEALKKSVTQNLRCVTQSCKGGVPLNNLQNDYKSLIGTAIPFTELGYKSLENFLQSLPDVVSLKKNKGAQCIVEGVADASTAHIASLISRQKTTKGATKKCNSKKPSVLIRRYPCHETWRCSMTNSVGICKQHGKSSSLNSANRKVPTPKPMSSGTISSASRNVVSANQNNVIYGLSNTKINPSEKGNWRDPLKEGTWRDPLKEGTWRDPLVKGRSGDPLKGGTWRDPLEEGTWTDPLEEGTWTDPLEEGTWTDPLEEGTLRVPLEKERSGKLYSSFFTDAKTLIRPTLPSSSSQKQTEIQRRDTSPNSEIPNGSKEVVPASNLAEDSILSKNQRRNRRKKIKKAKKLYETTEMFKEMLKENCAPSTLLNKNQVQDSCKTIEVSWTTQKQQLKELTLKNLRSVTLSCKGGVLLNNLQKDYKTLLGIPIPYKELGYDTLEAFIQDIPDVINLKKNKEGQIYAQAVSDATTAHISNLVSKQKQTNITKKTSSTSKKCSVLTKYASQNTWKTSRNSLSNAPVQELKSSSLETIPPPVAPRAITKSVLPSFSQEKPPHSALPKEAASNIVYKPTLSCFPSIKYSIASAKFSSLLMMNFVLFGDDSYMETLKRGILAFDGFSFCEGSEQWKQKELLLSMLSDDTLRECLKLLCIKCDSDSKEQLVNKLLQFLASPRNAVSNNVKRKGTEDIIRKEKVDNTGVAFTHFAGDVLENLKQLQECIHIQEYNILNEVGVKGASASNLENVQVCQSKNLNVNPSPVKVIKKKKSNPSVQVSSQESTGAESEEFQKLQNMFKFNPNVKVLENSADAESSSSHKSKYYHCQAYYALQRKKKKKTNAAKSETNS